MNKDMNKLLKEMIKYDLGGGFIIFLFMGAINSFINAGIYLEGICVGLINFLVSGYVLSKCLGTYKKIWIVIICYFIRIGLVALLIIPYSQNITYAIYYIVGFISHYILLIVFNIKNRKGSV